MRFLWPPFNQRFVFKVTFIEDKNRVVSNQKVEFQFKNYTTYEPGVKVVIMASVP